MSNENSAHTITFNNSDPLSKDFANTLNKRVNYYFQAKGISKYGNLTMYVKTVVMLTVYLLPFVILVTYEPSTWVAILLLSIMGAGMAGIGLSIMHDAIHGSYSSNQTVNKLMGYTLNLVGGNSMNWKIQHNVKHHTYTNIEDHDEDIEPKAILRFSPSTPLKSVHKYQFIYAWFFYGLGTFFWVTFKDFIKIIRYDQEGLLAKNSKSVATEYTILVVTKILYYSYIIGIPVFFTAYSGLEIFVGFLIMQFISGLGVAFIFQPAHLMEEVEYPAPETDGKMKYSWLVHQLYTTVNFANNNKVLNWCAGGLNFQVEHHLFPHICHVHYKHLAEIVKDTAAEFNLPYYSKDSFVGALHAHTMMLKKLGRAA